MAATPQVEIRDRSSRFVARVDLALDASKVLIEFDGILKYRGQATSEELVNKKRRELALTRVE
ncbi:MAG: hypothetical protein ABI360_02450 [Allobranchiibius sp.]